MPDSDQEMYEREEDERDQARREKVMAARDTTRAAETPASSLAELADEFADMAKTTGNEYFTDKAAELRARADAMEDKNPDACEHGEPLSGPCEKCDAPKCDFMSVRFGCCTLAIGHPGAHVYAPSRETPPTEPDGHTAGLLAIERDSLPLIALSAGERYPVLTAHGEPHAGYIERNTEANANIRHAINCWNAFERHFGQNAGQAAEEDELGAAISTAGEAVAALTFLRPQLVTEHRLLLDEALTPLRALLARVQRREA